MSNTARRRTACRHCLLTLALWPALAAYAAPPEDRGTPTDTPHAAQRTTTLESVNVTAQKRVERIQDVPIAISVFSAQALDDLKIDSGGELLRATPNVNFSKSNFASYNFSIRGIGTKALSVASDPAVAISFNGMPLVRNRLFEQEYFDVDRVEVLRGPQGTLYGRNAIGGVVNMLPNLPSTDGFEAFVKAENGNFSSRRGQAMLNVPLSDTFAIRAAGAFTQRDGFDYNTQTERRVNGRDLWSARASALWTPSERVTASLVWEHFQEDDDRSRTGKQLCTRDPGPDKVGNHQIKDIWSRNFLSQGCLPGSLYSDDAFGTPNGGSLPQVLGVAGIGTPIGFRPGSRTPIWAVGGPGQGTVDPYRDRKQSPNLREIATDYDPRFKADNDVVQLNFDAELTPHLTFTSQTGYSRDSYWSTQDYGRYSSDPIFNDSDGLVDRQGNPVHSITPGGVYTDPQLGPSKGMLSADLVDARSRQWSQEFRLRSQFDGRFNFNVGVNYLDFQIDESYYVFNNLYSLLAELFYNQPPAIGKPPRECEPGYSKPYLPGFPLSCVYIDPNGIDSLDGNGHNYFRSRNVARTRSLGVFGEGYWQLSDTLKLTTGLRHTWDRKTTTPYPTQLLLAPDYRAGGYVNSGYPADEDIVQKWGETTGRVVLDWTPDIGFTDHTLIYASYSRGYKAGGTNSPLIGGDRDFLSFNDVDPRFRPEFVNAFELGTKNTLAGGRVQLSASAFYYDYKDYQVSQIADRATLNENFDATLYGLDLEAAWQATERLRFNANLGYLKTRIANGEQSIDVLDRTQGNPDWIVVRPWLQQSSNCIAPVEIVGKLLDAIGAGTAPQNILNQLCNSKNGLFGGFLLPGSPYSDRLGFTYDPEVDGPNGGRGFMADLGGNELPNAPRITFNLGTQYTLPLRANWDLTLRGDYYRQGKSYARVYNTEVDKLRAWNNINLSFTLENLSSQVAIQLYVKNLLDAAPITDAFVNSDDTGAGSNVFTLDPRIIGLSISKRF